MTTTPVLAYPNNEDAFLLDYDASNTATGADLLQLQNGHERVIGYSSYVLLQAPKNYILNNQKRAPGGGPIHSTLPTLFARENIYCTDGSCKPGMVAEIQECIGTISEVVGGIRPV